MRTIFALLSLLALPSGSASAQSFAVYSYGIGRESCAEWLTDPSHEKAGTHWILGFWTGMNVFNSNAQPFGNANGDAIIGHVKNVCASRPSLALMRAVGEVYWGLRK